MAARAAAHLRVPQHRDTYYVLLGQGMGAASGVLFWLLFARFAGLTPATVGEGYAMVALGTTLGLLAKGGLDTALLRHVPLAGREEGGRLLLSAGLIGASVAALLASLLAVASGLRLGIPLLPPEAWLLVGLIATFLVVTWLQDARFLAERAARSGFLRNLALHAARLALPLPVLALLLPFPVAASWALALGVSALVAVALGRRLPPRAGRPVHRRLFLRTARRNVAGSAAEFLPGLLLAPIVLAISGPEAAAYFGIAWTAAMVLFLASTAIGRVVLSEMVRGGPARQGAVLRRGVRLHLVAVAPLAVLGILLAPLVLGIFGPGYAREGAPVLVVLCASTLFVAPSYLYLAVLRAQERPRALLAFPVAMVLALVVLVAPFEARFGLVGVAAAWTVSNAPFGLYAAWRLRSEVREVASHERPASLDRAPHPE